MYLSKKAILIAFTICEGGFSFAQFSNTSGNISQQTLGTVAIGYPSYIATSSLQVKNGSVLFEGAIGTTPISGAGARMMWIPSKKAFRAGAISNTQWDDSNIGICSFASGNNTTASGTNSSAFGSGTATGSNSAAFCNGIASGTNAFSINGTASGNTSFSAGTSTISSGLGSCSFGRLSTAYGYYSTVFGSNVKSEAGYSFVIGQYNILNTAYNRTAWILTDPLFVIGNGTSATSPNNAVTVLKNGNVLINKATQINSLYKLDVNGKMRAIEIVVNTTGADFVFDPNYDLMPLNLLEEQIRKHKHLPGVESAENMQKNGVELSQLNTLLLQKTEELTLYIIDLNKRISILENQKK